MGAGEVAKVSGANSDGDVDARDSEDGSVGRDAFGGDLANGF